VIFTIEKHGNVLAWQCEGVKFAKRKAQPGKTVALVAGGVALIVVVATIFAHSLTFNAGPIVIGK
jgi:hypothetical protein